MGWNADHTSVGTQWGRAPTLCEGIAARIKAGEQMKLIANFGNGVDNIDVATAVQRGITVTNTPGVLTEDTADMTMALILAVPRRLVEGAAVLTADKDWAGWSPTWMLGHRIWGKRLGIIGMGRIGQAMARRRRVLTCAPSTPTPTAAKKPGSPSERSASSWTSC